MEIKFGIYEEIFNHALQKKLQSIDDQHVYVSQVSIDKAEASSILSDYMGKLMRFVLKEIRGEDSLQRQIAFCNKVINFVDKELELDIGDNLISIEGKLITGILSKIGYTDAQLQARIKQHFPVSGLSYSSLFTGASADMSIDSEIEKDILTSDRVYWIVSFIRWSGLRLFENCLRQFTSTLGKKLKIITTTYMAATEPKAIKFLSELPNTEIKISYQTKLERLHAKAYIFERDTGYDTAYIGSSNLSHSALTKGLEWNIRVTNHENPHIIEKAKASFDYYWNSIDFEDLRIGGIQKFSKAIELERRRGHDRLSGDLVSFSILPFQKEILDKLTVERNIHHRYRNLIVAATGTGKTVISAFDFKRYYERNHSQARLLFVAHRREILVQACRTFRNVLGLREFGQLWFGSKTPDRGSMDQLFVSVQTFNSQKEFFRSRLSNDFYDYIVIDEAHHSQADSYRELFNIFSPKILLGLTATPERMDGLSLLPDFCDRIAAEIRLPDSLAQRLLSPFHYFCITDDSVDLRTVTWSAGKYDATELSKVLTVKTRADLIIKSLHHYLADPHQCKALCFCTSREHAIFMSEQLQKAGFRSTYLISGGNRNNEQERTNIHQQLKAGNINFVCVVDIFNEGVDIPEIDTVLFLRPTESLTVFLQQLGRGLRISENKDCLTVLDFVSQAHVSFNFAQRFRALVGRSDTNIQQEIENGFSHLPAGCSLKMEAQAREYILGNIRNAIYDLRRLIREITAFPGITHRAFTMKNFLEMHQLDIRTLYRNNHSWNALKIAANMAKPDDGPFYNQLNKGLRRLIHIDSPSYIRFIKHLVHNGFRIENNGAVDWDEGESRRFALMFYYDLWQKGIGEFGFRSIDDGIAAINHYPIIKKELEELIECLWENLNHTTREVSSDFTNVLEVHARYSRDQILAAFGKSTPDRPFPSQEGVVAIQDDNAEVLLVTLNKSDKDFSPSTQYEDYAISETIFHWQSQNRTSPESTVGLSYIHHKKEGKTLLLFVREGKKDSFGMTMPYHFLGPVKYLSHKGSRPMSINWELIEAMPSGLFKTAAKMAAG